MSFAENWMKLKIITVKEISEVQKKNITYFALYVESRSKMMAIVIIII
jgi:hypothetical protein